MKLREWQKKAKEIWFDKNCKGTIAACTGSGKTYFAIDISKSFSGNILVIVPTVQLLKQWHKKLSENYEEEIGMLGGGKCSIKRITVAVMNSLWGKHLAQCELLIFDEVHRAQSVKNSEFLLHNNFKNVLGISATPERDDEEANTYILKLAPVIFRYNLDQGIKDGVVSVFCLINERVSLEPEEFLAYNKADKIARSAMVQFGFSLNNLMKNSKKGNRTAIEGMKAISERKKIIYNSAQKLDKAVELLKNNENKRLILFDESIDNLAKIKLRLSEIDIPASIYHSKLKKSERKSLFEDFETGKTNIILSCRALEEGVDVPDIDSAIILNGSSKIRQQIQRIGRSLRKTTGSKKSLIYQVYVGDTKDEDWLRKRSL